VDDHKLPHCATQQNWLSMAEMGQDPSISMRSMFFAVTVHRRTNEMCHKRFSRGENSP
jgi:hypothetical protein